VNSHEISAGAPFAPAICGVTRVFNLSYGWQLVFGSGKERCRPAFHHNFAAPECFLLTWLI